MAERGSVGFADIEAAAERLAGLAVVTPVLENATLNEAVGARVLIKPECLQRTGSFKFRGAYNRISQLTADELARGVVAWSSGNHAQGVAAAARLLGTPATIVMPHDAPRTKLESYDHVDVIAGQGTCGLEFAHQLADREVQLESLLVCCGGGGLISGIATAFQSVSPDTRIYAVEPEEFDDTARSLKSGERVGNAAEARSICDALLADRPGVITFAINQRLLAGALTVSDQEVQDAMRFSFEHLKLVVEPGGAVALAAALAGKLDISGATVGIIISGGNVDAELFASTIATRRNRSGSI
jgi:threonine dehydratase